MKIFLEIFENTDIESTIPPQIIRLEVPDRDTALAKYNELAPILNFEYTAQIHYCRHDEGLPCEKEEIK